MYRIELSYEGIWSATDLYKMLSAIRNQKPDTKVVLDIIGDVTDYINEGLTFREVLAMFRQDGPQPLDIEVHLKCCVSQFFLLAFADIPKDKVFVAEDLHMFWFDFNNWVWGTESEQYDRVRYYEILEETMNSVLTSRYGLDLDEVRMYIDDGERWKTDDIINIMDAKPLVESETDAMLPEKLEIRPEPIYAIRGGFHQWSAGSYVRFLDHCTRTGVSEAVILINSPGGCVASLEVMLGANERFNGNLTFLTIGQACSAGAVFLISGEKGKRGATSGSVIMIHQYRGFSDRRSLDKNADFAERIKGIIVDGSTTSKEEIEKMLLRDTFLSAEEALDYGFIDYIVN